MFSLGVDLGGTNIAVGVVSEQGEILCKKSTPTPKELGAQLPEKVAFSIVETIFSVLEEGNIALKDVSSIGIGAPGTINPKTKTIGYWSNLDFRDVPLGELVARSLKLKGEIIPEIYLENDANAAALGEFFSGAGKNSDSLLAITLGTGVGGGAIINQKLFTGFNYAGLEVGHFVIETSGKSCTCGRKGCFETYASATALISQTKETMLEHRDSILWECVQGDLEKVNGRVLFEGLEKCDSIARSVFEKYVFYLASGVSSLINLFQPEIFCIGGGISGQNEVLLNPLRNLVDSQDYAKNLEKRTKIVVAELGNDAGIIGAANLAQFQV